jgi:hypothetical protein
MTPHQYGSMATTKGLHNHDFGSEPRRPPSIGMTVRHNFLPGPPCLASFPLRWRDSLAQPIEIQTNRRAWLDDLRDNLQ